VDEVLRALAGIAGAAIVVLTLLNAVRTFVLPRAAPSRLIAIVFHLVARILGWRAGRRATYAERDRIMALHAPIALLLVPLVWIALVISGYTLLFLAFDAPGIEAALVMSGSSLTTLGFATLETFAQRLLAISEGALGLGIVALVIAYLPSMYAAFQRRETKVALLETRAGAPPNPIVFLQRFARIGWLDHLGTVWQDWEHWFSDVQESHTSLAPLVFFRSPRRDASWVVAAGAVLDAAAFHAAVLDVPPDPRADLCIRSGYLCLRHIADFFGIVHDPDPAPDDPISVSRAEFADACAELNEVGAPLKADLDQAWLDWAGWRVNYDRVLIALAGLTMAPEARWSGDRPLPPAIRLWQPHAFDRPRN
jgi:hypothetical protein